MANGTLQLENKDYNVDIIEPTVGDRGIDVRTLRSTTGMVAYDPGLANTASCKSAVTYIDGDAGVLLYRGYPIDQLARNSRFTEVAYLLINGELPTPKQQEKFSEKLTYHTLLHEDMKKFFEGYPPTAHPMAILSAMIASLSTFYPENERPGELELNMIRILAKAKTIAAFAYKKSIGQPFMYPQNNLSYAANFLHMMFAVPAEPYEISPVMEEALNKLLILHADHEQNCSTSTVRAAASSEANLFASVAAGVNALWGPLHGGANQAVIEMLDNINADGGDYKKYVEMAKDPDSNFRLMGFGHRVYKNYDPRAKILKEMADRVLGNLGYNDPLLDLAQKLEDVALSDSYFVEKKLYPNVDFYSGLIYRAIGIPTDMFTVMFALGRIPGWIAHFKELRNDPDTRIWRPRQVYVGEPQRQYIPPTER